MTNQRDTGRYDAIEREYIDQQVRIDFAWGNIPIQPNDDRGVAVLDPVLDSHEITYLNWNGFPAYVPNTVDGGGSGSGSGGSGGSGSGSGSGGGGPLLVSVPSVVDFDSVSAAAAYLVSVGLVLGNVTTSTEGATSSNWGWVKSQSPSANASVAPGTAVDLVSYNFVSSATTGSVAGFTRNGAPMGWSLNGVDAVMFVTGRSTWPAVNSTINVTGSSDTSYNTIYTVLDVKADNSYNTGGTAIKVTRASGSYATNASTGGTWSIGIAPSGTSLRSGRNWALESGTYAYFGGALDIPTLSAILANPTLVSVDYAAGGYVGVSDATMVDGGSTLRLGLVGNIGTSNNTVGDLWTGSYPTDPAVSSSNLSIIAN